jgi:hypothetical protein
MEVHHHSHTERKKWTHYLWEFLMLFLAVFCGFLAENFREHYVEHQRAAQLAANLYKELYADSILLQANIDIRNTKEASCNYFINYVRDSDLTHLSETFYPAFTRTFVQTAQLLFEPHDGILNQLRNSGELRYFKNPELQARVGDIGVAIANVRTRNDKEYSFVEFYLRPFTLKYYDFQWYEEYIQHGKLSLAQALSQNSKTQYQPKIINASLFNRQEAQNITSYYLLMLRGTRQTQYHSYADINHVLLEILRAEYHFK